MNDEELERLLRAANPASSDPIPLERQRAVMERIMAEPAPSPRRRAARRAAWIAVPLGMLAAIAVVFALVNPFASAPAVAYGPPPLTYTPTDQTFEEVVRDAQARLAESPGPAEAERRSYATSWNLVLSDEGEPQETTFIAPEVTDLEWFADLSGTRTLIAGEPYPATPGGTPTDPDAPAPGTVLDEQIFEPGAYVPAFPDAGALDVASATVIFDQYSPDGSTPGNAMLAVADLFTEWTLTNAQHGDLLEALLAYDDITVLGVAIDRQGREVIGVQGAAQAGWAVTLLISTNTGRIVGIENTIAGQSEMPVPLGTVVGYSLWKDAS